MTDTAVKVVSIAAAIAWRRQVTGVVVFTNGVFDLLHPGHVDTLENARAIGDHLIVAVNEDESVARLAKGPDRPIVPVADRCRVIAALAAVDRVVTFAGDTPEQLIHQLRPDVLVKGADYDEADVPGWPQVRATGGRLMRVPIKPGYSTTALLDRIRHVPA